MLHSITAWQRLCMVCDIASGKACDVQQGMAPAILAFVDTCMTPVKLQPLAERHALCHLNECLKLLGTIGPMSDS